MVLAPCMSYREPCRRRCRRFVAGERAMLVLLPGCVNDGLCKYGCRCFAAAERADMKCKDWLDLSVVRVTSFPAAARGTARGACMLQPGQAKHVMHSERCGTAACALTGRARCAGGPRCRASKAGPHEAGFCGDQP